jgi:hypothetical protein
VIATRTADITERARKCLSCGYTWQTVEIARYDGYLREYIKGVAEDNPELLKGGAKTPSLFGDEN